MDGVVRLQVLCRQREDMAVAKTAHVACVAAGCAVGDGAAGLSAFVASRGPTLEAALRKRLELHGPAAAEVWLMGLSEAEVAEVVALAEWAVAHARSGGWLDNTDADVVVAAGPGEGAWAWHRARLAVDPERTYDVLGRVLSVRETLALPFEKGGALVERVRAKGAAGPGRAARQDDPLGRVPDGDTRCDDLTGEDLVGGADAETGWSTAAVAEDGGASSESLPGSDSEALPVDWEEDGSEWELRSSQREGSARQREVV